MRPGQRAHSQCQALCTLPEYLQIFSPSCLELMAVPHWSVTSSVTGYCHSPVLAVKNVDVRQPILLYISLLMVSIIIIYLNFGLPLGLTPFTSSTVRVIWLSSLRLTCLFFWIKLVPYLAYVHCQVARICLTKCTSLPRSHQWCACTMLYVVHAHHFTQVCCHVA